MSEAPYFIAKRIAQQAETLAPLDPGPVAVVLLNQLPPWQREKVCPILSDQIHAVVEKNGSRMRPGFADIQIHSAENHAKTWRVVEGLIDPKDEDDRIELSRILDPAIALHEPVAHLGSWEAGGGWYVVEPEVARKQLGLTPQDVRVAVGMLAEISDAKRNVVNIGRLREVKPDQPKAGEVVVGVCPYADMLPLPALIYAVSDLVSFPVSFRPAYVFGIGHPDYALMNIGSPDFDLGYALAGDRSRRKNSAFTDIFSESITRSIATRELPVSKWSKVPFISHFSMLGDLSVDGLFHLQDQYTSAEIMARARRNGLQPDTNFDLSAVVPDPGSVELAMLMALQSMRASADQVADNQAYAGATVSTDAHAWAVHNGLLRSYLTPSAVSEVAKSSLMQIAWSPRAGDDPRDVSANLAWFTPRGAIPNARSEAMARDWKDLGDRIVFKKIQDARISDLSVLSKNADALDQSLQHAREACASISQALLAPLLTAFPQYAGPIRFLPPEAWMAKIISPYGHMDYVPYWQASWNRRSTLQVAEITPGALAR